MAAVTDDNAADEQIDLSKENVSEIIYEVVNAKAANAENQGKCAPNPRTCKPRV